jgi:hypothetical protein
VKALVEDLARLPGATARHRAADVALVRDRTAEPEQLALDEGRSDDGDIGGVGAAAMIRVVDDEAVAFRDVAAKGFDDGGGAGRKGADVEGQHDVLRHDLALRIHQRAGRILRLPHDGGKARAEQRILHLLHDPRQARLHHLEVDRVDRHGQPC